MMVAYSAAVPFGQASRWPEIGKSFDLALHGICPPTQGMAGRSDIESSHARDQEGALLLAFGQGDGAAAAALIDLVSPRVLAQATRMIGNRAEAEEIAQEAMLKMWRASKSGEIYKAKVSTWLYSVTANLCIDRLRHRRATLPIQDLPEPVDPTPAVAQVMLEQARKSALCAALANLPERQALAVSLRFIEGLQNPEIADIMGVSIEAVESLTARGKRALALALSNRREELGYANE